MFIARVLGLFGFVGILLAIKACRSLHSCYTSASMLVIRLQRTGRENLPTYRLVVAEKARPVKGKYLEVVGHYLPARKPSVFEHSAEKIKQWISKGATPSDTVARLLKNSGMEGMEKFIQRYAKQKSKKEVAAAPAASTSAQATADKPAVEAPKVEAAAEPMKEEPKAEEAKAA